MIIKLIPYFKGKPLDSLKPLIPDRPRVAGWLLVAIVAGSYVSLSRWEHIAGFLHAWPLVTGILLTLLQGACTLIVAWLLVRSKMKRSTAIALMVGIACLLAIVVGVVYPRLNQGGHYPGASDRDEALNAAISALLDGRYPYTVRAFVQESHSWVGQGGNPISAMPGELLMSMPFHLLGLTALQNVFWLLALCLGAAWVHRNARTHAPAC